MVFVMVVGTTAEVDLDKVEAQILEEVIGILLVVLVQSYAFACHVAVEHATAGVTPCIAIDTCLQTLGVNMVNYAFQSIGETL